MGDVKMIVKSMSTSQHLATILALIVLGDDNMSAFNVFEEVAFVIGLILTVTTPPILS